MSLSDRFWPALAGAALPYALLSGVRPGPAAAGAGAVLESKMVCRDGTLLIADHHSHETLRMMLAGARSVLGRVDAEIAELVLHLDYSFSAQF